MSKEFQRKERETIADICQRADFFRELEDKIKIDFLKPHNCTSLREFLDKADIPKGEKDQALAIAQIIIQQGLQNGANFYAAAKYSLETGEVKEIRKRMKKGITSKDSRTQKIYPNYDLLQVALNIGDDKDMQKAVSAWVRHYGPTEEALNGGKIREIRTEIQSKLERYAQKFNLPDSPISLVNINGAMEIPEQEHDLAVGIHRGCAEVTNLLDATNLPVRYIRYSQEDQETQPYWSPVGRNQQKISKAKRIIICEDDVVSGTTLQAVHPLIERLNPEVVDIYFCGYTPKKSCKAASALGYYTNVLSTESISFDRFVANLKKAQRTLKKHGF